MRRPRRQSRRAGFGGDALKVTITDNEAYIEDGGVPVASYLAPGELHPVLGRPALYELEVDGVTLIDWLTDYVNGEDVPDVACTGDCGRPATEALTTARTTPPRPPHSGGNGSHG